jgi:hypothetical protein
MTQDEYKHCTNCGQSVAGAQATDAANPATQFCCQCGLKLAEGKCQNTVCRFFGEIPICK